ncbi:carboxymuconolactone decarboxylase family protein, partial [bacterium]|nr:carboxymuconolactone decarboxylase family protein [bacterium]
LEGLILLQKLPEVNLPVEELYEEYTPQQIEKWEARGQLLCQNIYRKNFKPLLENVGTLSPTLRQWMLHEGYGRVLARPSLSIDIREMGIIAILTVKNYPRQLHSHLKGALHVGVSRQELRQAIEICAPFTTSRNITDACQTLDEIAAI